MNKERKSQAKRIRVLILTPTRELTNQVAANVAEYSKQLSLSSMAVYRGVDSSLRSSA